MIKCFDSQFSFKGWMSDKMGSYDETFYTSGVFIIVSGAMMFLASCSSISRSMRGPIKFDLELHHDQLTDVKLESNREEKDPLHRVCIVGVGEETARRSFSEEEPGV